MDIALYSARALLHPLREIYGVFFIHCCRRYFVYGSSSDNRPEVLGKAIVGDIPRDPKEYQEWLQDMRKMYSNLSRKFEEEILCVSPKFGKLDFLACTGERYAKSYLAIDDRLQEPPIQTLFPGARYHEVKWTYIVDLDRELLIVNSSVPFKLARLSLEPKWFQYLGEDSHKRLVLNADTPEDLIGDATNKGELNPVMRNKYRSLNIEIDMKEITRNFVDDITPRDVLLCRLTMGICSRYMPLLDAFYHQWNLESFSFKEIAFAILSVAAGEMALHSTNNLNRVYEPEGFYLIPGKDHRNDHQTLLPTFLSERHAPGSEPGSAPKNSIYWLNDVLVCLAHRMDLVDVEEAKIAEVVHYGLEQGTKTFRAVVFSIMEFVLIQVQETESGHLQVIRSPLINLFYFDDDHSRFSYGSRPRESEPYPSEDVNPLAQLRKLFHDAFDVSPDPSYPTPFTAVLMLIRFFDVAVYQQIASAGPLVFPSEIMSMIMKFADQETSHSLTRISAYCRAIHCQKFPLNDDYAVVGIDHQGESHRVVLEDLHSGQNIISELDSFEAEKILQLLPIIGIAEPTRRSILNHVSIGFSNASPPLPSFILPPIRPFGYYAFEGMNPDWLFNMPDYFYLGSIEGAWRRYLLRLLRNFLAEPTVCRLGRTEGAPLQYFHPPGYRRISMDHVFCNGLQGFIRDARDESPEEWEKTMKYAVRQLHRKETLGNQELAFKTIGFPVIVAFTRKVKLFYYVHQRAEKPLDVETSTPHCVEVAEKCVNPDPRARLVQIGPGDEPFNLDDKQSRRAFEEWICIFRKDDMMTEYEPWTGRHVPYPVVETVTEEA